MKNRFNSRLLGWRGVAVAALLMASVGCVTLAAYAQSQAKNTPAAPRSKAEILDGFRHVEAASVSDALEQVIGKKMYMSHRMRPIFPAKFAGYALTVALKKEENDDP